ncbi:MAG TPA: InlB B-repeat-containing protein [Candidatus Izemoplasmatales bacterium]|nr:InlB B-repeat-containing protein [Candidatus Izemoplasmatales bacterium]
MFKRFPMSFFVLLAALAMMACGGGTTTLPDLKDLSIEAVDATDIPAGVYEIPFNRDEIEAYVAYYDVAIELSAVDSDGIPVDLDGDAIVIVAGKTYTVTIHATVGDAFDESRTITLRAVGTIVVHTVTFDLNGAPMTAPITREVTHGGLIPDFPAEPIFADYDFSGWCRDAACTTPWSEEDDVVISDITLYAQWTPVVAEHDDSDLFINCDPDDDSRIENNLPVQIYSLWMGFAYMETEEEAEPIEFGLVYSEVDMTPGYFEEDVIVHPIAEGTQNQLSILWFGAATLPLEDETFYAMRAYAKYKHDIYYGEIVTYETAILVPSGQSVGLDGIVSGGRYYVDNGTTAFKPRFWCGVLEGYEATLDVSRYTSFSPIERGGLRSMFVVDGAGDRYLHVFELVLRNSPAEVVTGGISVELDLLSWRIFGTYEMNLLDSEHVDYDVEEAGVLFSSTSPYLELDLPGVYRRSADEIGEDGVFTNDVEFSFAFGNRTLYVRGYAIVDGRTVYSTDIRTIEFADEYTGVSYEMGVTYTEVVTTGSAASGHSFYPGNGVESVVTVVADGSFAETEHIGSFVLVGAGTYYVRQTDATTFHKIVLLDPQGVIEGVTDGATYQDAVVIVSTTWNATLWISKDGGPEVAIASGITLSEPGVYVVSIYLNGAVTVTFTIE